ncbi:MAG: hypothetical protein ACK4M3_04470 [Pyrobaculum sp.]
MPSFAPEVGGFYYGDEKRRVRCRHVGHAGAHKRSDTPGSTSLKASLDSTYGAKVAKYVTAGRATPRRPLGRQVYNAWGLTARGMTQGRLHNLRPLAATRNINHSQRH